MSKDTVFIGPFFAPLVYGVCIISMVAAVFLIFTPRYKDNLFERCGASLMAFAVVSIWYHMVDGLFIPRAYWTYGLSWVLIAIGMLYKLPRKRHD